MLVEKIKNDLTKYLKSGDKAKVSLTRLLLAAVKDKEISLRNTAEEDNQLNDSVVMDIIKKMIKQRNLAIESFKKANRLDLVEKEELESQLLSVYLPTQLTEEELNTVIAKVINDTNAESIRDMSTVMKVLKEDFGDQCDFQKASKMVKEKLSKTSN
ncbi:MAG: glutamyl-tRNA amidotransferase [Pelagibacterales bacterium]|nr:glutamyl-tRNA amidotransferase [Pelagibacterales bacterium]|tara:strand:- start:3882 stop:4352 length:471 start_codon:yes stop_codon:yes gene_type:complete